MDGDRMYRRQCAGQREFSDFYLPFSGHLDPENRWIRLARIVPWQLAEAIYVADLCEVSGAPIVPARTALGALLVKERLGLTDRETVEAIQENPYLQFFIGLEEFTQEKPFDASLMVDFRKRFGAEGIERIAEAIALAAVPQSAMPEEKDEPSSGKASTDSAAPGVSDSAEQPNRGKLIVDATCAPADIRYPTDVSLLNEAREKTDELLDTLHEPLVGKQPRPRTYRVKARRQFVAFVKQKKPGRTKIRRANRQQLGYLKRNLQAVERLLAHPGGLPLTQLSRCHYKDLLVCRELYRQQQQMYDNKTQRVDDRIVSIQQPHVRPIKRGKAGRDTEFGAKLSLSLVDGFSFVDRLSWDNYNESLDLVGQIEAYHRRFGFYPESVHVDKIYRSRENRAYCKQRGIRMSGPPLGRTPLTVSREEKRQAAEDEAIRNRVEGKFGQGKRRFGLARVMAKLASTSAAQILLTFLMMNLERALQLLFFVLCWLAPRWSTTAPGQSPRHHQPDRRRSCIT
jgi:transposase, IS5 family